MAERISWFVEDRVIWVDPEPVTTVEVLAHDNAIIINMIREAIANTGMLVHVVIDGSKMKTQPSPLEGRNLLTYIAEPGMGYRIVAGNGNPIHYFFSKFVGTLNPGSTMIFPNMSQALSTLTRKDESLPDLNLLYRSQLRKEA